MFTDDTKAVIVDEIKLAILDTVDDADAEHRKMFGTDHVIVVLDSMHLVLLSSALGECLECAAGSAADTVLGRDTADVRAIQKLVSGLCGVAQSQRRSAASKAADRGDHTHLADVEKVLTEVALIDNVTTYSKHRSPGSWGLDEYGFEIPYASVLVDMTPASVRFLSRAVQLAIDFLDDWDFSIRTGFTLEEAASLRDALEAIAVKVCGPRPC